MLFSSAESFFFAAEVLSWRTRLLRAGHHYDRLVADTGRLGVEAAQARAEAAAARRSLDEANWLHEQLAGNKRRLEAEVGLLKVEAAKVAEAQQALVEADQQRGHLADDKGWLQAEVDHLREQLASDKSRLKAEVEHLRAEAAKVVEAQRALAEADQQCNKLGDDKGQLQAEVKRLKGQVTAVEGPARRRPTIARRPRRRPRTRTSS